MRVLILCAALALTSCSDAGLYSPESEDGDSTLIARQKTTHVWRDCDGTTAVYYSRGTDGSPGGVALEQHSPQCGGLMEEDPKQ